MSRYTVKELDDAPFEWEEDLDEDCCLNYGKYYAQAEDLGSSLIDYKGG